MVDSDFIRVLQRYWPYLLVAVDVLVASAASVHVVMNKRDTRSAVSWVGLVWLSPFVGSLLYLLFGINRIERKAVSLRRRRRRIEHVDPHLICTAEELAERLGAGFDHLVTLSKVGETIYSRPLLEGNAVKALLNGEQAYPAMLQAIDSATKSVALLTYIFEKDEVGDRFIETLARAAKRGVDARVLIDGVGGGSTLRASIRALRASGVKAEVFQPLLLPLRSHYMNLRNHRKILVVDGTMGFTGGMNIRRSHCVESDGPHLEQDVHFQIQGPVVEQLQEAFVDDWAFVTTEVLLGREWLPGEKKSTGTVNARGIPFDPGENLDSLSQVLAAAMASARKSIRIVNPYFLPEPAMIMALNVAALRGVEVEILIPEKNDLLLVQWAIDAQLWQVLQGGCRVWKTKGPFEHTKLMVVDGAWTFLGSANFDPRSLRLNFEFNVECYDVALGAQVEAIVEEKRRRATPVKLDDFRRLPFWIRLRNSVARLFSPYL